MESSEKIRCKNCSSLGEKSYRFCKNCGHEIEQIKSTKVTCLGTIKDKPCNNILTYDARFCQNCGTKNPQYVSEEKTFAKGECIKESLHGTYAKEQSVAISLANKEKSFTEDDCFKESQQRKDVQEQPVTISEANKEKPFAKGECSKASLHGKDIKEQSVAISAANKEKSFTEDDCFKESQQRKDVQEQHVTISEANGKEETAVSVDTMSTGDHESALDIEVGEEIGKTFEFMSRLHKRRRMIQVSPNVTQMKTLAQMKMLGCNL